MNFEVWIEDLSWLWGPWFSVALPVVLPLLLLELVWTRSSVSLPVHSMRMTYHQNYIVKWYCTYVADIYMHRRRLHSSDVCMHHWHLHASLTFAFIADVYMHRWRKHSSLTITFITDIYIHRWHLHSSLTFACIADVCIHHWHLHSSLTFAFITDIYIHHWHLHCTTYDHVMHCTYTVLHSNATLSIHPSLHVLLQTDHTLYCTPILLIVFINHYMYSITNCAAPIEDF